MSLPSSAIHILGVQLSHGLLVLLVVRGHAVPAHLVLHEAHALALDGLADDGLGQAVLRGHGLVHDRDKLRHVVAVAGIDLKAEGLELLCQVHGRHDLLAGAVQLQIVPVHKDDQVVQLVLVGGAAGLPDLALVALAVAQGGVDHVVLAVQLGGQRHAHRAGQTLAQRAGGDVDAGALVHAGVALQGGALLAQGVQDLHGEEALHGQRRVLGGAHMALGEDEAVTVFPAGPGRIHVHIPEVAGGDKVCHGQGAAGMAALRLPDHVDHMLFQIDALVVQFGDGVRFFHGRFSSACKDGGNAGNVGDDQQDDQGCDQQGDDGSGDLLEIHIGHAAGHVEVDAHGRGEQADGEVHDHDHAQMDHVHTQGLGHGDKERGEDIQGGGGIQEAPGDEQQDVDDDEEHEGGAVGQVDQPVGDGHVQPRAGQDVGKEAGAGGDEHDGGGGAGRVDEDLLEVLELYGLVHEYADDETVDHGHGRGFGGGEDAAVDAAQNDDGHQQAPEGVLEGLPALGAGGLGLPLQVHFAAHQQRRDDQTRAHDQAGDHAGLEQVADGGVRDGAEHHEGDGGRDDDADGAGAAHQGGGKGGGIAGLDHAGDQHQAQGGHGGRAGAGDGGEEAGHDDAHDGKAALHVTHAGLGQVDQPLGDLGLFHDVAGEDEEGDGQQHKLAGGGGEQEGQAGHDGGHGAARALDQHGQDAGGAQAHRNGRAGQKQDREGDKQNGSNHFFSSSLER